MKMLLRQPGEAGGGVGGDFPLQPSGRCLGDGCEAVEPWPVHQIRHRNNDFLRLCTSCVLKQHPGYFCCSCFEVFEQPERPPVVHCSKCPSVAHLCCLPDPSLGPLFLCPACDSPSTNSFSYFPFSKVSTDRVIDLRAAKILHAASHISATSMTRAAALARIDAEKKVKEAALARKRARDMLDRSLVILEKERGKIKGPVRVAATAVTDSYAKEEIIEPKKKVPRPSSSPSSTVTSGAVAWKREQDREREKWKRFSDPVGFVNKSTLVVDSNEKIKGHLNSEAVDGTVAEKMEKKAIVSDSQVESGELD